MFSVLVLLETKKHNKTTLFCLLLSVTTTRLPLETSLRSDTLCCKADRFRALEAFFVLSVFLGFLCSHPFALALCLNLKDFCVRVIYPRLYLTCKNTVCNIL